MASLGAGRWAEWRGWRQRRVSVLSGRPACRLLSPRGFSMSTVQSCLVFSPGSLMGLGADCLVQLSSVAKGSLPVPVCLEQNGSSNTAVHPCEIAQFPISRQDAHTPRYNLGFGHELDFHNWILKVSPPGCACLGVKALLSIHLSFSPILILISIH